MSLVELAVVEYVDKMAHMNKKRKKKSRINSLSATANPIHTTIDRFSPVDETDSFLNAKTSNGFRKHRTSIIEYVDVHPITNSNGSVTNQLRRQSYFPNDVLQRK